MTREPPLDEPVLAADEQASCELLAAYLADLHAGRPTDREALLAEHPELASALRCLDDLDQFAALAQPAPDVPRGPDAPTHDLNVALLADSVPAAAPPRLFGDYELLEEIGRGGMGVVYKSRQPSLGRLVALKMVSAGNLATVEELRRFAAEAQAAANLRHPHIVRLLDSGEVAGQPYLAMDYIDGPSLARRLAKGPLSIEEAVGLVVAVARAVDYLHRRGIVHRDIKPSNILLDEEGRPYITDFGLAKIRDADSHLTKTGVAAGTPSYMAPEQAAGHTSHVTEAADVYSLGAVLYELLTGRPPFQASSAIDVLIQVIEREPVAPRQLQRGIPRALETICLKCLEKSPENRYASAAALADDLERFEQGEVVEARAAGPWQRVRRWARREPALASRLAVFALYYSVEAVNYYLLHSVDAWFHYPATAVVFTWAAASVGFQQLIRRTGWQVRVPFAWEAVDIVSLTVLLLLGDGVASPLSIGFPLLVVGSGLWFRVRLVCFMTCVSLASYLVIVADSYLRRPELQERLQLNTEDYIYFLVGLAVIGAAVAYQVQRVRALSRYYERRQA